jgi:hypothetical protein
MLGDNLELCNRAWNSLQHIYMYMGAECKTADRHDGRVLQAAEECLSEAHLVVV